MFRWIRIRAESAKFYTHNRPSVLPKHTRRTLPFQSVAVLLVVGQTGCSKSSCFSPAQPRRAKTRRSAGKAAASAHLLSLRRGGWDDPNCARPTRAFSSRALRVQGDRPTHPTDFFSILLAFLGSVGHKRRIQLLHFRAAAFRACHGIRFMLLQRQDQQRFLPAV